MARKFNLEDYETVKERKARFYTDHPDGRIVVTIVNGDGIMEYALYYVEVFESKEDQACALPKATGTALELRDKAKSISSTGNEYESVNYTSWTENAEESAVGRALDNAGYAGNKKCSREEILKVEKHIEILDNQPVTKPIVSTSIPVEDGEYDPYECPIHKNKTWFKSSKMRNYAHPIDGGGWCNMDKVLKELKTQIEVPPRIIESPIEPPLKLIPLNEEGAKDVLRAFSNTIAAMWDMDITEASNRLYGGEVDLLPHVLNGANPETWLKELQAQVSKETEALGNKE